MPCCHEFVYRAVCINCGGDALAIIRARSEKLDAGARRALGFLVNGQRVDAENALRAAIHPEGEDTTEDGGSPNTREPEGD